MRRLYFILPCFIVVALAVSVFLIGNTSDRARHLLRDGRIEAAAPLLENLYEHGDTSEAVISPLVNAKIRNGDVEGVIKLLGPESEYRKEPQLLTLVSKSVRASLDTDRYARLLDFRPDDEALRDKVYLAQLRQDRTAEIAALQELRSRHQIRREEISRLAALEAEQGRLLVTVELLRESVSGEAEQVKKSIVPLTGRLLARAGVEGERELISVVSEMKNSEKGDDSPLSALLWTLLDSGYPNLVSRIFDSVELPVLNNPPLLAAFLNAKRASGRSEDISFFFDKSLGKDHFQPQATAALVEAAVENGVLMTHLVDAVERGVITLTPEQLRRIAFAMLEKLNDPDRAAHVFQRLAANEGPYGENVKMLLYVWGPRPDEGAIAWVKERALTAPHEEHEAWVRNLATIAGARTALDFVQSVGWGVDPSLEDIQLELAAQVGLSSGIRELIERIAAREHDSQRMIHLAEKARDNNLRDLALRLAARAIDLNPGDSHTLAFVGMLRSQYNDLKGAAEALNPLFAGNHEKLLDLSTDEKVQVHYHYGTLLEQRNDLSNAKLHFGEALELVETAPRRDHFDPVLVAELIGKIRGAGLGAQYLEDRTNGRILTKSERLALGRLLTDAGQLDAAKKVLFDEGER